MISKYPATSVDILNCIPLALAVIDRDGITRTSNRAWQRRLEGSNSPISEEYGKYAAAARCVGSQASHFNDAVSSVFLHGETARLLATFLTSEGGNRQMDVTVAPLTFSTDGGADSVLVSLAEMRERPEIESLPAQYESGLDLSASVGHPLAQVKRLFCADVALALEIVGSDNKSVFARLVAVCDDRKTGQWPKCNEIFQLPSCLSLKEILFAERYLAVADICTCNIPDLLKSKLSDRVGMRSFLAVPIYLQGDQWGALLIGHSTHVDFSALEVDSLRNAANVLSISLLLSQQKTLHEIDETMASEVTIHTDSCDQPVGEQRNVCRRILEEAIYLTASRGGHIRIVDWDTQEAVIEVGINDPQFISQTNLVRARLPIGQPVSGIVAQTLKPYFCNESRTDNYALSVRQGIPSHETEMLSRLDSVKSFACLPLVADGEILGTLCLSSDLPDHFTSRRRLILTELTRRAAIALRTQLQLSRMQEMVLMVDTGLDAKDLHSFWLWIPSHAVRLFKAETAAVWSYDQQTGVLVCEAIYPPGMTSEGRPIGEMTCASDEPGCGISRYVAMRGGRLQLKGEQLTNHPHMSKPPPDRHMQDLSHELHSAMWIRLESPKGLPVGVLKVENRKGRIGGGFTDYDAVLFSLFSQRIAIEIARLRLLEVRDWAIALQAHDLKAPISTISVIMNMFQESKYILPNDMTELNHAARRLRWLDARITTMIEVAKGELHPLQVNPKQIVTSKLLDGALDVFYDSLVEGSWEVSIKIDHAATSVFADEDKMQRALINMIGNVLRHGYGSTAGDVDQAKEINISVKCEGEEIILAVADRGPGIPQKLRATLLQGGSIHTGGRDRKQIVGLGFVSLTMIAAAHLGSIDIQNRDDGKSGAVVMLRWNQECLLKLSSRAKEN